MQYYTTVYAMHCHFQHYSSNNAITRDLFIVPIAAVVVVAKENSQLEALLLPRVVDAMSSLPSSRSSSPVRRSREVLIIEDDDTVASYEVSSHHTSCLVGHIVSHGVDPIKEGLETTRDQWQILLVGQVLSVLIAGQGAAQSTLYLDCHLSAPTFATGLVYLMLTLHLLPLMWKGRQFHKQDSQDALMTVDESHTCNTATQHTFFKFIPLQTSAWTYFGIALLDVEANYFTVLAFRFTSLTSASVLDAMAIPSAMVFSRLCLHRNYLKVHLLGVAVCLCGMLANVFCDLSEEVEDNDKEAKEYPHLVFGDVLAILGGLMFGARDVLTENNVRKLDGTCEYLGMIGLLGTLISAVQVALLERNQVNDFFHAADETCPKRMGLSLLMTYVLTTAIRYVGQAHFLIVSEAALLNLSLLTGDLWSAIFEIVAERIVPPSLFWVSLVLVVGGVFVYEIGGSPISEEPTDLYLNDDDSVEIIDFSKSQDDAESPGKEWKIS